MQFVFIFKKLRATAENST